MNHPVKVVRTVLLAAGALLGSLWLFPLILDAQADKAADTTLSPFGIGSDDHTSRDPASWIPQMAAIGIKEARSFHIQWGDPLSPSEGKWDWTEADKQMDCLASNGIESGGLLFAYPTWASKSPPWPLRLPTDNIPAWNSYVTAVVNHFHGKIKYWEVWNEPPNFIGDGQTPADYAKIVAATYDTIKAIDPTLMVGLATKSVNVNYLSLVIKGGAKDHFDYITVHPYEVLGGVAQEKGTESIYMHIVPTIRKMLADVDPDRVNAPVIFTELGSDAAKGAENQAEALIKAYAMGIAGGVASIDWFEGKDGDSGAMGLMDANGTPRPAYKAMGQIIEHLGQHPTSLGWLLINDKDYAFVFQGSKGTVLITWAPKGEPDHVDFGQEVSIVDPLTGTATKASTYALTPMPIIVDGVPDSLVAQAKANQTKPFPWGGDYTDADSVTVTMGATTVDKGLHTQGGDSVAADVVAYGGSARSGSIPGGNCFMVDPNFLSYTATPIRITAVVRRNDANDEAGFNLIYEAETPGGFKNAGKWYSVPDNKEWHTATWDITDARFVSYWGYNFCLNSDGDKLNKYDIQSVTVTKLPK